MGKRHVAGSINVGPAVRLARVIGLLKWAIVGLWGLVLLSVTGVGLSQSDALGPIASVGVAGVWFLGLLGITVVYVAFGWFQHTLLVLTGIARNTASDSGSEFDWLKSL